MGVKIKPAFLVSAFKMFEKQSKMYLGEGINITSSFIVVLYKFEGKCYFRFFHFCVIAYSTVKIVTRRLSVAGKSQEIHIQTFKQYFMRNQSIWFILFVPFLFLVKIMTF